MSSDTKTEKPKKVSKLYDRFETDPKAVENGTPVEIIEGAIFDIRSASSIESRKWLQKRIKANRQKYASNDGVLTPRQQDEQDIDQAAEVLITGWRGDVTDRAGNTLGYTVENCRKLMKDLPQLCKDIHYAANEMETYRKKEREAVAGNSDASSNNS